MKVLKKITLATIILFFTVILIVALIFKIGHQLWSINDIVVNNENSEWEAAKAENSPNSYQSYLRNYPKGNYAIEANKLQEEAYWNEVLKSNKSESYYNYINLYKNRNGKYLEEAYKRKENVEWIEIKKENTEQSFNQYITRYPNGIHIKEALRNRVKIRRGISDDIVIQPDSSSVMFNVSENAKNALANESTVETPVSLYSQFNVSCGITTDGFRFKTGGFDGMGYSCSADLLGTNVKWNNTTFDLGPANAYDVIGSNGQIIPLKIGKYRYLKMLACAKEYAQESQHIDISYTDGTSSSFVQSFSSWRSSQDFPGESKVVSMNYRNTEKGKKDNSRYFYLYGYSFNLKASKEVNSIKLPKNGYVRILAITLEP